VTTTRDPSQAALRQVYSSTILCAGAGLGNAKGRAWMHQNDVLDVQEGFDSEVPLRPDSTEADILSTSAPMYG
jgi:hypothetical protein